MNLLIIYINIEMEIILYISFIKFEKKLKKLNVRYPANHFYQSCATVLSILQNNKKGVTTLNVSINING